MDQVSALLPETSLVPFAVRRVAGASVAWTNDALALARPCDQYAYISAEQGNLAAGSPGAIDVAYAERYGGKGVGANGGGARCGLYRGVQIKGIGRNGLIGMRADRAHSSGELTMKEALKEALWGEVYQAALPHGAARGYAVLDTGMQTQWRDPAFEDGYSPRALLLRQAIVRPAHYLRAIDFSGQGNAMVSDRERTAAAIQRLPLALAALLAPPARSGGGIGDYLVEVVRRCARQNAAAIVRRLPHGSVNCSNIGLDGTYIDFYHATHISDFGRIITYRAAPELFDAHTTLHPTIHNLCFYVNKYMEGDGGAEISGRELWQAYLGFFAAALQREFLLLTGLPPAVVAAVPDALASAFYGCVKRIVQAGNREPFCYPQMPYQMGDYRLSSVLGQTAFHAAPERIALEVQGLMGDSRLGADFVRLLCELRHGAAAAMPAMAAAQAARRWAWRCAARNSELPELYRFNLDVELPRLYRHAPDQLRGYIGRIVRKVQAIYADGDEIDLAWLGDAGARLSFVGADLCLNGSPIAPERLRQELARAAGRPGEA